MYGETMKLAPRNIENRSVWALGRMGVRFGLMAVMIGAMVCGAAASALAQNVGTITRLDGTAQIERGGQTLSAANHMAVALHDKITTDANGWVTITMIDDSSLSLGASSTLTIDESMTIGGVAAPSKVGLVTGRLHSVISGAMKGTNPTFEVHTPNAVGAVRGTEWDTTYDENDRERHKDCHQWTEIWVESGVVDEKCGKKDKEIHAGEHALCGCGFWLEDVAAGGFGIPGWIAVGAIVAGGGIIGGTWGGGGFGGQPPPESPVK